MQIVRLFKQPQPKQQATLHKPKKEPPHRREKRVTKKRKRASKRAHRTRKKKHRRKRRKKKRRQRPKRPKRLARWGRRYHRDRPLELKQEPPPAPSASPSQKKPRLPKAVTKQESKRSYRHLDLRPRLSPRRTRRGRGKGSTKSGAQKGKGNVPWAGKDRFGRTMRAYHARWKEWHLDYSGLTDTFFGTAQVALDRCLEIQFQSKIHKYMTYGEMASPTLGPKWTGSFIMSWSKRGKPKIVLKKTSGHAKLNRTILQWARGCIRRVSIPKRLHGKKLWVVSRTKLYAVVRTKLSNLFGFEEVRDPRTGGIKWKFAPLGSIRVWSNTLFLRQRILP